MYLLLFYFNYCYFYAFKQSTCSKWRHYGPILLSRPGDRAIFWVNYSIGWILGRWDVTNRSFWYGNQSFCPLRAGTETSERDLFVGGFLGESCPQKWRKNAGQFESSMFRLSGICFTTFVDRFAQRRREIAPLGLNFLFPGSKSSAATNPKGISS